MKALIITAAAAALLLATSLAPGAIAQDQASKRVAEADAVYQNGFVYTVDGEQWASLQKYNSTAT